MKQMGRKHRPFYRICAMDIRTPRDGRVLEELGTYDPMVPETDARAVLNGERINYWLGVGAQPSDKVKVLIKKYGANGTHVAKQKAALDRLAQRRRRPSRRRAPSGQAGRDRRGRRRGGRRRRRRLPAAEECPTGEPAANESNSHALRRPDPVSRDFPGYLGQSLLKRAIEAGLVEVRLHNIRDWSTSKHNTVDDRPFGGGPGMVMKVEPVVECVEAVRSRGRRARPPGDAHAARAPARPAGRRGVGRAQADPAVVRPVRRV